MTTKKLTDYLKQQTPTQSSSKTEQTEPAPTAIRFKKETEFQETPIGKIPKEWKVAKLIEVAEIRKNKIISNVDKVAFISMEAIPEDGLYAKYEIRDFSEVKSYVYCEKGDILLAKVTPCFENGKQAIVPDNIPTRYVLATTEVYPIIARNINREFLFYILKYERFRKTLEAHMKGTTGRRRVPRNALENLLIPLPPFSEQKTIAELLSSTDSAIEKVRLLIDRAERFKKGLIQELFTKGIGHKEYKETPIGRIPKEWQVLKLGQLCQVRHGKRPEKILSEGPYPIYGAGGFSGYTTNYLSKGPWTIVVGRVGVGSVGKVYLVSGSVWVNDNAFYLLPLTDKAYMPFVYYALLLRDPKRLAMRSSAGEYAIITQMLLEGVEIPLPPLEEQKRIAEILLTVDKYIEFLGERLKHLEHVKRGLMEVLLTGKVRILVEPSQVFIWLGRGGLRTTL